MSTESLNSQPISQEVTGVAEFTDFQRKLIDRIETGPITEIIPEAIQSNLDSPDTTGDIPYQVDSEEPRRVRFKKWDEGITVAALYQSGVRKGVLESLYFIDEQSGRAVDVASLWSKESYPDGRTRKVTIDHTQQGYYPRMKKASVGLDTFSHWDRFAFLHELGHMAQDRSGLLSRMKTSHMGMNLLHDLSHLAARMTGGRVNFNSVLPLTSLKRSSAYRDSNVLVESNAHAFALSVIRKLKDGGVDIMRGISKEELVLYAELSQEAYDKRFSGIPGRAFSQKGRAVHRRIDGFVKERDLNSRQRLLLLARMSKDF